MNETHTEGEEIARVCCDAIYWCNRSKSMECPNHGGFDVCCDRPLEHYAAYLYRCTMCQAETLSTSDDPPVQPCWQCGGLAKFEREMRGY